jgi:hypothetical protein
MTGGATRSGSSFDFRFTILDSGKTSRKAAKPQRNEHKMESRKAGNQSIKRDEALFGNATAGVFLHSWFPYDFFFVPLRLCAFA